MIERVKLLFAALFMLIVFLLIIIVGVVLTIIFLIGYLITGSAWLRSRVTNFGIGLDQAANVVFMDGNPKETISSHAGRYYEAKYGNPYKGRPATRPGLVIPWQAVAVCTVTNLGEKDHVLNAVEQWAVDAAIPL